MKVGFGKKKQKQKQKQKKKDKTGKGGDGDDTMADAAPAAAPSPEPTMTDAPDELNAKSKQRQRMELKKALKVQVASLKSKRNKLTKMAGNKKERQQLNSELKDLVQGQLAQDKQVKGPGQQHAAKGDAMAD